MRAPKKSKKQTASRELWRGDGFGIALDTDNWTTYKISARSSDSKEAGEEVKSEGRYFSTMSGALRDVAKRVATRDANTLEDYIRRFEDACSMLADATRGL